MTPYELKLMLIKARAASKDELQLTMVRPQNVKNRFSPKKVQTPFGPCSWVMGDTDQEIIISVSIAKVEEYLKQKEKEYKSWLD